MKQSILFFCSMLLMAAFSSFGQQNNETGLGGSNNDTITYVSPLNNGKGYLVLGTTNSFTPDKEIFLMKTDDEGNPFWMTKFSVSNNGNEPIAVCEANDGGNIVVYSKNGSNEIQIAKYADTAKTFTWIKATRLEINSSVVYSFVQTPDKTGYLLALCNKNNNRSYVLRIENDGTISKSLSEQIWDVNTTDIEVNPDGSIYLAGTTNGNDEIFLMKIDANLQIVDTKYFKSIINQNNTAKVTDIKIDQDKDNNFIIAAFSAVNNKIGKVIIKTDFNQTNTKVYEYGLVQQDDFRITDVAAVADGYVFTGYSTAGYVNSLGGTDILYIWCDSNMSKLSASIYGGKKDDRGQFVYLNADKTVTIFSISGSFSKTGDNDFYIIKTSNKGAILCNQQEIAFAIKEEATGTTTNTTIFDNPFSISSTTPFATPTFATIQFTVRCTCSQKVSFETSGSACVNESVMFTFPTGNLAYVWDFGGGVIDSTTNGNNFYIRFSTPGIRYISLRVANNSCYESASKAVVIYPLPSFTIDYSPKSVCGGAPINFSSAVSNKQDGPWTYNWDFGKYATPATSTAENPQAVKYQNVATALVDTVSLTLADAHCSAIQKLAVSINPTPTASFTSNAARCSGLPVSFKNTGTAGASYSWNFAGANVITATGDAPQATYGSEGLKTVQLVTSLGSCRDTATETITIYATPSASPMLSLARVCEKARVDASATVSPSTTEHITYSWDFGADAQPKSSDVAAPKGISYAKAGVKTISLSVQTEHCSSVPQTTTLTVNQKPKAEFDATTPQCTGEKVSFLSTGSAADSYQWTFTPDATAITGATEKEATVRFTSDGEKTVVLVTGIASCYDTVQHGVTIHKTPSVAFSFDTLVAFKKNRCVNDTIRLKNMGETGQDWNFSWNLGEGASPAEVTSENASVAYSFGGTKNITLKIASDYCSATKTATITIDTLPVTQIVANGFALGMKDIRICANTSVKLSASPSNETDFNYKWYIPTNTFEEVKVYPYSTVTVAPKSAETVYTLKIKNKTTECVFVDSIHVTMLPAAIANAGIDVVICRGETVQIGAALIEGQTYSWNPSKGMGSITEPNPLVMPDSTTIYTLKTQYRGCPVVTDEVKVTVHQLPKVKVTDYLHRDSTTIARGESIQLLAIGALQYIWTPVEGLSNEGVFNPIASPNKTTIYTVTGTDIYGCVNSDSIKVTVVVPKLWIPTAFTPNDDNNNDGFIVRGDGITKFELQIFTRNGEQVFYSEDPKTAWNGRKEGANRELPQGAYIYYTKGTLSDGTLFEKRGVVNLLR